MIKRQLVRLVAAIGAAWWLARVMFSQSEHRKLHLAMQAIGEVTAPRAGWAEASKTIAASGDDELRW